MAAGDLRQIGVFDQPGRDPRGRYVTVAYAATVRADTPITAGDDARSARWWPLNDLPDRLAFDHADILSAAARDAAHDQFTDAADHLTPQQEPTR